MKKENLENPTSDFYSQAMLNALSIQSSKEEMILNYITSISQIDEKLKKGLENPFKSPSKCWKYIEKKAGQHLNKESGYVLPAIVFGWAVHYYTESDDFLASEENGDVDEESKIDETSASTALTIAERLAAIKSKLVK